MIVFWIAAALLAAGASALILGRAAAVAGDTGEDPTVAVYRRALAEIDDLADRELIAEDERRAARTEAARRLINAADGAPRVGQSASRRTMLIIAGSIPLAAVALYFLLGSPGLADQPFAGRLAAWRAHPERYQSPELAAALRSLAAQHPNDPEPLRHLAALDLSLGDANGAVHALRKADAIAPGRPEILAPLGEILVLKARGTVGADAQAIFREVIQRDPRSPSARYYLGRARIAGGDRAGGLSDWRGLLADLSTDDPRRAMLSRDIASVETTGAPDLNTPLQPAERSAMSGAIRGMVDGLASRLAAHPDDPQGWVRLVRAYTVLGEADKREAALDQARRRFAGEPAILAELDAARKSPD
ncbi:MAG TPA: c-type cytochrome biogenesis protein CcmI [Caulobacteraceae bacterium]|nr:c-type cytochrome biogenesis protein CcmI [Caulobacteraceae bacterium]